jgi:hypothetical protein
MTLYEKFGWVIPCEDYVSSLDEAKEPPQIEDLIPEQKDDLAAAANNAALCYYLKGDIRETKTFARQTVWAVLEVFYGTWRNKVETDDGTIDPEWWRFHLGWIELFRYGCCWAAALHDWESLEKIAQYPSPESSIDLVHVYTKEDKALFLALAGLLRNAPLESCQSWLRAASTGKKEKPQLLAEVVKALHDKDNAHFQEALTAHLRYFPQREFKKKSLTELLSLDGTTLFHFGRNRNLDFEIPEEAKDHIIQLD